MTVPKSRILTSSSTFDVSPKEKKPLKLVRGIARPAPVEPSNWFCQATSTRKRLAIRQSVLGPGTQGFRGSRKGRSEGKLAAKAPSTVNCCGLQLSLSPQPPKSWPTTCPLARSDGDPELPPKVPPMSCAE